MLHDTRNQHIFAVAYRIDLNLLADQIFVNEDRVFLCNPVDDTDKCIYILIIDRDLHALTAEYIRRPDEYRIAKLMRCLFRLFRRKYSVSGRTRDAAFFQHLVKQLTVLRTVYILCGCSEDRHTHLHQSLGQLDRCLSTKLHDCSVRMLQIHDALDILRGQRLKIQLICDIEIGTYRLRVIIDDDGLIALLRKGPGAVYGTEIKLDTLADPDRAGTKHKHLLLATRLDRLILAAEYGVVIRSLSRKFCRTRINHLKCCHNAIGIAHIPDLLLGPAGQARDNIIRELDAFCFLQKLHSQRLALQCLLHLNKNRKLINKPYINFCNVMNLLIGEASADRLCDDPDPTIVHNRELTAQRILIQTGKIIGKQAVYMLLQGTDRLHQTTLKIVCDTHDLTGRLHLCRQLPARADEFIKRKTRHLYDAVIQHRLKARIGFSGNRILDLIQGVAKRNLRRYLRDRITRRLGSQCRGTADTRIYFDDAVLEAVRIQSKLHIAASGDLQLADDVQCRRTEHLILLVAQRLGRCHYDTVSGVYADRIDVLHIADRDHISCGVAHYLILNLLPARDAALH